jgi:hypothetical protein
MEYNFNAKVQNIICGPWILYVITRVEVIILNVKQYIQFTQYK